MRSRDRVNGGGVLGPRRLDGQRLCVSGEERLTDDRIVDQIEDVSGISPQLGRCRVTNLITQLTPGRPPVIPVPDGICGAEEAGNRVPYRLVNNDSVSARLNEWEIKQSMGGRGPVTVQHRGQDRLGRTTYDAPCLKRLASDRILDIGEVHPAQLVDNARHGGILESALGVFQDTGRSEHQRERMASCNVIQSNRFARRDAPPLEQLERIRLIERPQREFMEAFNAPPPRDRTLPAGEHQADLGRQERHESLTRPGVHEPKDFIVIEDEHDWRGKRLEVFQQSVQILVAIRRLEKPRSVGSIVRQSRAMTLNPLA